MFKWNRMRPWTRHSLVLMVAGIIYVLIGISYATADPTPERIKALHYALKWMPFHSWGIIFVLAGLLSVISSRWPPVSKTWGYTVLTGLSGGWAGFYAVGILFGESPMTNVSGVMSWGLIAFLWWAISGLVDPYKKEVSEWTAQRSPL